MSYLVRIILAGLTLCFLLRLTNVLGGKVVVGYQKNNALQKRRNELAKGNELG